jgi:hypothetical protein
MVFLGPSGKFSGSTLITLRPLSSKSFANYLFTIPQFDVTIATENVVKQPPIPPPHYHLIIRRYIVRVTGIVLKYLQENYQFYVKLHKMLTNPYGIGPPKRAFHLGTQCRSWLHRSYSFTCDMLKEPLHVQFLLHNKYCPVSIAQVGSPYTNQ